MPDSTYNDSDNVLEITFTPNANWESKLESMSVSTDGGESFYPSLWDSSWVSSGKITLPVSMPEGTLIIKFHATGYKDAVVSQVVLIPVPNAEIRIKTTDNSVVQVDETRALIYVNPSATVAAIRSKIISYNGTIQSYNFIYSDGDSTAVYSEGGKILPFHSSALHVTAQDGSTIGYYTILVNS